MKPKNLLRTLLAFLFDYASLNEKNRLDEIQKMFAFLNLELSDDENKTVIEKLNYQSHSVRKNYEDKKIQNIKANIKDNFNIDI